MDLSGGELAIPLVAPSREELNLKLIELRLGDCPAYFFITFPAGQGRDEPLWLHAWQAAAGRGFDRQGARDAAICEALERASLMSGGPDDPRIRHAVPPGLPRISALTWANYSAAQLQDIFANGHHTTISDCASLVDNLWMVGGYLSTSGSVAVSATAALFGEDTRLGLPAIFSTSTGGAVRDTLETAREHAVLELIERDHVALWWYNRLPAPRLDPGFASAALPPEMTAWLGGRRRRTLHLLLPGDLPAPVVVALSVRADGTRPAIGAAAALDPADAVRSATLEMLQGEIALANMRAAQGAADPPAPPPLLAWSERTNLFATPYLAGDGPPAAPPAATSFAHLAAHLEASGIDVVTVDLTRPELGAPVVKALSTTLRDWLPRFGPGRLYDVPVALGLRRTPIAESDLNPTPFVI